jgi:DNA-binding transcriptional LysR family regulator
VIASGMELRQLHYFVTLAEELHFGRAAERLHIVQPAVSQQLRRLEAELGARLVDRSSHHVALTSAGRQFLPEARAVLAAAERARAVVAGPATLRLGTSTGLGARLPRLLAELERRLPGQPVELVRVPARARLRQVADGTLDAALLRGAHTYPGLRLDTVWMDDIIVALPADHPIAATNPVTLTQLQHLPLRLPGRDANPPLVDLLIAACREAGFEPRLAPAMNDQDMLAAIAAGSPTWTVYYASQAQLLHATGVAFRAVDEPPLRMPTQLAMLPEPSRPALDALLATCRAVAS